MSDDADNSDDRIMQLVDAGIAKAREQMGRALPVTGLCHYCGTEVRGRLFCGKDCSTDYDYEQARRKAQGK
jgi:hypothetical protein